MSAEFSHNISTFDSWKSDISRSLSRFRLWLKRNQLSNDHVDSELSKLQSSLKQETLTLAFVGEFSRGKTELINALFFADYGQRILPSEAGRTTMCPTELFYDSKEDRPYLRLLPIETRLDNITLTEYRNQPELWEEITLETDSAQEMSEALLNIVETKEVSLERAIELGFSEETLEFSEECPENVVIPVWRHALISFPHEILKLGLNILDTPGLNALGSEPELTLKMLPQAQAIVFLLGADTGVTASDMAIWDNYVKGLDDNLALFAVLNKVDTLWDELSSRKKIDRAIKKMVNTTAKQLKIKPAQVIPTSAQKALVAKVRDDKSLLIRTQITELEHLLSVNLLKNKEEILFNSAIKSAKDLINETTQVIVNKNDKLIEQKQEFESLSGDNSDRAEELLKESNQVLKAFEHRRIAIRPSQRLLERQTQILLSTVSNKVLSNEISVTLRELVNSRTTVGLYSNMKQFYASIDTIMRELNREAELANKMTISLYEKFNKDFDMGLLEPKLFPARKLSRELDTIIKNSKRLNNGLFTTFTEHSAAIRRFFSGTVNDVMAFFKSSRTEMVNWTNSVLLPLTQQLRVQQELLSNHQKELQELNQSRSNLDGKIKGLSKLIKENEMELETAQELIKGLEDKKAFNKETNIIRMSSANRK
jgi:hypothetical protein